MYLCALPNEKEIVVELPLRLTRGVWIKNGSYLLVDTNGATEKSKVDGEVIVVVRKENAWRKQAYWPKEFPDRVALSYAELSEDEEESRVGKMPPSDSESD